MERTKYIEPLIVNCDGAARGNPGEAGIGIAINDSTGKEIRKICKYIGIATNNKAEYTALIVGASIVNDIKKTAGKSNISAIFFLDSELVVNQINGIYKVKNAGLKPLFSEVKGLLEGINYEIKHIPREENKHADMLANEAIDSAISDKDVNANKFGELFNHINY